MAATPNFASTPRCVGSSSAAANTALDGTGTLITAFTAGPNGSRLDNIMLKAAATTVAGMIRLFIHDGTTARLLTEVPVQAITPSGTVSAWEQRIDVSVLGGLLLLPSGSSLRWAAHAASAFNCIVTGYDA